MLDQEKLEAGPMGATAVCNSITARESMRSVALGLILLMAVPGASSAGVLSESDFRKVEEIKPLFQSLMGDLMQTSKRPDISSGDTDCVVATIRELLQVSEELSSYEYLITIEKEVKDFGDNSPVLGVVKFAIEKTNTILAAERKRLAELSERCARFPVASGKTQQALRFIDTTTGVLSSIQVAELPKSEKPK
jgi:hypothetical protein